MFGRKNVKIPVDRDLYERVRRVADIAGYATPHEFVEHILEKEMLHFEEADNEDDVRKKLRGLGYIS